MKYLSTPAIAFLAAVIGVLFGPIRTGTAQEAEVITAVGRQIIEALGRDTAEFGGEEFAQQTAKRLLTEAVDSGGSASGRFARVQLKRILARGKEPLIFDLKAISGKSLPLLEDVSDDALPSAVGTLARPSVCEGLDSIGSFSLRKSALAGEMRLPGAGLKLVEHYGSDGARLATELTEDQANSLVAALRPNAVNALPSEERSSFLNALSTRPDARVFNLEGTSGPLLVVAGGVVIWHGIDVAIGPDERVIEQPDGTVIREKTTLGSRVVGTMPLVAQAVANPLKWTGSLLAAGLGIATVIFVVLRRWRVR